MFPFIAPYHNSVENTTGGGKNYCWLCYVQKESMWKKYYLSRLSGPLLSANVRFIEYQNTNSIPCTFSFTCEVQLLDSNYGFVWHGKDNICNNKFYLLYFTHDTKGNNPQIFKILICSDKKQPKKQGLQVNICDDPPNTASRINFDIKSKTWIRYWFNTMKCVLPHFILGCEVTICNGECLPFNPLLSIELLCGVHFWIKRAESRFQLVTRVESHAYLQL